jgi:hypothetical protein
MSFLPNKIVHFIIGGLIFLFPAGILYLTSAKKLNQHIFSLQKSDAGSIKGYRDIIFYNGKFLAVGNDGRIDFINHSGEKIPAVNTCKNDLNCVVSNGQMLVVAGNNGTILFSADGQIFTRVESGTDKDINGITCKYDLIIAGVDNGTILISKDGKSWNSKHLEVKGNILSLSANDSFCIGITDRGEIIRSNDGFNWEIKDYNKDYSGYNKSCTFRKVIAAGNRIVIIGSHDDGTPAVLFSSLGNVWTERSLIYNDDQGMIRFLTNEPNDIAYDPVRDQFILACDNGELFSLPSCTKCNASVTVSNNNLYAIICTDDFLVSAGEEFFINIMKF